MEKMIEKTAALIEEVMKRKGSCILAVDGRCASGKSTFGQMLKERTGGSLVHMDDFFLQPYQRTQERYSTPGENVDHERFLAEVLEPLSKGQTVRYHPFDCRAMEISEQVKEADGKGIVIVEGSYSFHPSLREYYDLKIFLHADPEKQLERIRKRNPDKVEDFRTKWIPYEELYFSSCRVSECADQVIDTTNLF
jgi:uridine kinase